MARLSATLKDLDRIKRHMESFASQSGLSGLMPGGPAAPQGRLVPVEGFGSNPGALKMLVHVPRTLAPRPGLVVVLHGCTQSAAGYDLGAGWSTLADRFGFVVLCPEQNRTNNPQCCFNWFSPHHTARGGGEVLSIRQMVERAIEDHGIARDRVFVTGLSAGGAMTAALLAAYPEVFAGGGVVAGLPSGAADNLQGALAAMRASPAHSQAEWVALVKSASDHDGPWPRLSVWHGGADRVVEAGNAAALVRQWTGVHGLPDKPTRHETVQGFGRDVWCDATGREVIESVSIPGMGHGTPVQAGSEIHMAGQAGAFLFDVGISSSYHMARFWGLADEVVSADEEAGEVAGAQRSDAAATDAPRDGTLYGPGELTPAERATSERPSAERPASGRTRPAAAGGVGQVIEDALRSAGLMK